MSARSTRADVVIVGSGATGGWAAKVLAEMGLQVVVLEAGRKLDPARDQRGRDYWQYSDSDSERPFFDPALAARQHVQARHPMFRPRNHHFFVDDVQNPYETPDGRPFSWIRGRQEGGRSMIWGGQTWRLSGHELQPAQPPGLDLGWPIDYDELAPCYDEVERFLGVAGCRDGLDEIPDGEFVQAHPSTPAEIAFQRFVRERFQRPIVVTRSIRPDWPAERYEGDASWPRFSSLGSTLAAATRTGHAQVFTCAVARRVLVDRDTGRASGVECVDAQTHEIFEISAGAVVLCASTIESARLLLHSDPRGGPDGLGNASGVLGRYLSDHCFASLVGVLPADCVEDEPERVRQAWNGDGLYIPRFRNRGVQETDYYGGFGTMLLMGRRGLPIGSEALRAEPHHTFLAVIFGEVLPRADNRITLSSELRDAWGIPAAHIDYTYSDNEHRLIEDASASIRDMLERFGCRVVEVSTQQQPGLMVHEVGTARMGASRASSYLDPRCGSWEVPNLFVTDGAAWPTSAYQNPTLTMMALTVRACRFLGAELRRDRLR